MAYTTFSTSTNFKEHPKDHAKIFLQPQLDADFTKAHEAVDAKEKELQKKIETSIIFTTNPLLVSGAKMKCILLRNCWVAMKHI